MTKVLIYGGSFNPPHLAHVEVPFEAMNFLSYDNVIYVPAFQSPLKDKAQTLPEHRLEMLKLTLGGYNWASISTVELERGGTSYTIDTIEELSVIYDELRLLIGADQWLQFKQWHRWEDILEIANPVIMPRVGFDVPDENLLKIKPFHGSSTDIRTLTKNGKDISHYVNPSVKEYISEHSLYL